MELTDIQALFNRAVTHTFYKKKLLLTFIILALCGILVVFFRALAQHTGHWVVMSLTFLPIFLCTGVLLSLGIFLTRLYHDEIKNKEVNYGSILSKSWELMLGASYFCIPVILIYLVIWMLLGIFLLFRSIPGIGDFFGVILAFAPFLLNLTALFLCLISLGMLFFLTPVIALRGINKMQIVQILTRRFNEDWFSNLLLAGIAFLPTLLLIAILILAAVLTGSLCTYCSESLQVILQWFFIMLPFTAALSPAVVFFFNFAAEAHVYLQKQIQKSE